MSSIQEFSGTVACSHPCQLGEGPTYDPANDTAWWFDIVDRKLFQLNLESDQLQVHELPFMASVLAFVDEDKDLIAAEDGLYLRERQSGSLSLLQTLEADIPGNRSNDGRVHPCGALWISTMGNNAEPQAGSIYHYFHGTLTTLYANLTIPNAICFSLDGRIAYFTDTSTDKLIQVNIDPTTALPSNVPTMFHDHKDEGGLDGAVIDADGNLWNARWGAGCVDGYTPAGEKFITLAVPASQTSCPAFVGSKANRLLVTSATQDLSAEALAADPKAGQTIILNYPVSGRFEPRIML